MSTVAAAALVAWTLTKVQTPAIPYVLGGRSNKGTDCINLIAWAMEQLGGWAVEHGSNRAWQRDMSWTGTLAEAKAQGRLVPGAILYIDYGQPPGGAAGTVGKMDHAGVYVGSEHGLKTPEGKRADVVHASQSRGGVYGSTLANGWTHVAWLKGVDYEGGIGMQTNPAVLWVGEVITEQDPLNVRESGPGGRVLGTLARGSRVEVLDIAAPEGWVYGRCGGLQGYISQQYLRNAEMEPDEDEAVGAMPGVWIRCRTAAEAQQLAQGIELLAALPYGAVVREEG